ncbi:unnamed protein product [Umbelopsis vinacea]
MKEHPSKKQKLVVPKSRSVTEPNSQVASQRPIVSSFKAKLSARVPATHNRALQNPVNSIVRSGIAPAIRSPATINETTPRKSTVLVSNKVSEASRTPRIAQTTTQAQTSLNGPPLILPDLRSQVPQKVRQMTVTRLYEQFLRIYEPLSDRASLAHHHAAKQERDIHENSVNQAGYKQTAAGVLGRLKKRVPAADNDDVGIDGEWTDKQLQNERSGISSGLRKYILSEAQLADMSYPLPNALDIPQSKESPIGLEHQCDRCGKPFIVKDVLSKQDMELCRYHHGRLRKIKIHGEFERLYYCCNSPSESLGCTSGPHVYKGRDYNLIYAPSDMTLIATLDESVEELAKRIPFAPATLGTGTDKDVRQVIALDCEMAYTTAGMELVRISAIDEFNETVLDELVLPQHMIIDLNSRYSGIQTLRGAKYNLQDIRKMLAKFVDEDTILAGHGLENDMKALRIVHMNIVDTVALYPHPNGLPYRYGLRFLANKYLQRFIQDSSEGHDSFEDARTSLDLIKLKIAKVGHKALSMANKNLHAQLKERVEEYNLSTEEVAAIDKARAQLSSHTTFGGFTGAAVGAFLGVRRRFSPWASFALAGGGFLIGSQMGLVSGALAGVRTIKTLPNSEHLMGLVRDVQNEILAQKGFKRDTPNSPPRRMSPAERENERRQQLTSRRQDENGEFMAEDDSLTDNAAIERPFEDTDAPRRSVVGYRQQRQQQPEHEHEQGQEQEATSTNGNNRRGAWDKIRSENLPNERPTWAKLREQAQKEKQGQSSNGDAQDDNPLSSSQSQVESIPRTREEMEQATQRTRRNKYGDPVE